jgi:hypothetical protein
MKEKCLPDGGFYWKKIKSLTLEEEDKRKYGSQALLDINCFNLSKIDHQY